MATALNLADIASPQRRAVTGKKTNPAYTAYITGQIPAARQAVVDDAEAALEEKKLNQSADQLNQSLAQSAVQFNATLAQSKAEAEKKLTQEKELSSLELAQTKGQAAQSLAQAAGQFDATLAQNKAIADRTADLTRQGMAISKDQAAMGNVIQAGGLGVTGLTLADKAGLIDLKSLAKSAGEKLNSALGGTLQSAAAPGETAAGAITESPLLANAASPASDIASAAAAGDAATAPVTGLAAGTTPTAAVTGDIAATPAGDIGNYWNIYQQMGVDTGAAEAAAEASASSWANDMGIEAAGMGETLASTGPSLATSAYAAGANIAANYAVKQLMNSIGIGGESEKGYAGSIAGGMASGAIIGSAIPGVGPAVGAIVGGIMGAVSQIFASGGLGGAGNGESYPGQWAYQSAVAAQEADVKNTEAQKAVAAYAAKYGISQTLANGLPNPVIPQISAADMYQDDAGNWTHPWANYAPT